MQGWYSSSVSDHTFRSASHASVSTCAATIFPTNSVWSPVVNVSETVHSIQPTHPSSSGASTSFARKWGSRATSNFSICIPLTIPTHCV